MRVYFFETEEAVPYRRGIKKEFKKMEEGGVNRVFIPFDVTKLKRKQVDSLKEKILSYGEIRFATDYLRESLSGCFSESDGRSMFDQVGLSAARSLCPGKKVRAVIFGANLETALSGLKLFPDLALSGEGALKTSNSIYEITGAAVPVVSGAGLEDVVFLRDDTPPTESLIKVGYDLESEKGVINKDSVRFTGTGTTGTLCRLLKRSLTLGEAEILSENGEKPSFILCRQNGC